MEFSISSIRERAKIGEVSSKLKDLKKIESMIEEAADKGECGVELRYCHFDNFTKHNEFVVSSLRENGFTVLAQEYCNRTDSYWVSWS